MPRTNDIDAVAAQWVARMDASPLSREEELALDVWCQADPRHNGAFVRMRAISAKTERAGALGTQFDPQTLEPKRPLKREGRYRLVGWLGAAAASLVASVIIYHRWASVPDFVTERGEMRTVSLRDGSVMTLNTASRVAVRFDELERRVTLLQGEALFDVAKDPARPFQVRAGDASVYALGTSFTVRHLSKMPVKVLVRDGEVEVRQPHLQPLRLTANMLTEVSVSTVPTRSRVVAVSGDVVSRELAWTEGQLAFKAESLGTAATAFARYSSTRIVIDDPEVARKEITGLFASRDPIGFARAAAASLGLRVTMGAEEVRLAQ